MGNSLLKSEQIFFKIQPADKNKQYESVFQSHSIQPTKNIKVRRRQKKTVHQPLDLVTDRTQIDQLKLGRLATIFCSFILYLHLTIKLLFIDITIYYIMVMVYLGFYSHKLKLFLFLVFTLMHLMFNFCMFVLVKKPSFVNLFLSQVLIYMFFKFFLRPQLKVTFLLHDI